MHLRVTTAKNHRYAQLVESYRRKSDGMPMKRVKANLGKLSDDEIANIRMALKASRDGERVIVGRVVDPPVPNKPRNNLRYLDAAVLLELWREWGLEQILDELLPRGESYLRPTDVIASLVIQRCIEPGSKLVASRWVPETALPELLAFSPGQFNNTRVHRVLDTLDKATPTLMERLPRLYTNRHGAAVALFIDVTDTWFAGTGPDSAQRGKTKDGLIKKKIGIVLLCDPNGYPRRWQVIPGNSADCHAIDDMYRQIRRLNWVGDAVVVCDRAMGATSELRKLLDTGLRFLTAMRKTEFDTYAHEVPWQPFAELSPVGDQEGFVAQVTAAADATDMVRVKDNLFALELGVVERSVADTGADSEVDSVAPDQDQVVAGVRLGRQIIEAVKTGAAATLKAAAIELGLSAMQGKRCVRIARLPDDVLDDIEIRGSGGLSKEVLMKLYQLGDADQQRQAYKQERQRRAEQPRGRFVKKQARVVSTPRPPKAPVRVRTVAYFNPEMFAEQRRNAQRKVDAVDEAIARLNARAPHLRTREKLTDAVNRKLRKDSLIGVYNVTTSLDETGSMKVTAALNQQEWARRRRYDGFSLLVAHPDVEVPAAELCRLYRSKDHIEKDFQIIKSTVQLRPVRHYTDPKVSAHVTICMLALLLERTLGHKLKSKASSGQALEVLKSCNLNRYTESDDAQSAYLLTHTNTEQDRILRTLGLDRLADDAAIAEQITPR